MPTLHIVQGGVSNGDKGWLEKAAKKHLDASTWVVPKTAKPGDEIVIYVGGYGFFATALIKSTPKPRKDWVNRYGAGLTSIRLIEPAISLGVILQKLPELSWAKYPRSVVTVSTSIANKVRKLIDHRRQLGVNDLLDLNEKSLQSANLDELRKVALLEASPSVTPKQQKSLYRRRSPAIKLYVLKRSNGVCEGCNSPAPFIKSDGSPYLEPHHTSRLADDGPDHPRHVIALCPNCHRRAHYAKDAEAFNKRLIRMLVSIESK